MLNSHRLIIFCLLFAVTWVQSSKDLTMSDVIAIAKLEEALKFCLKSAVSNHYNSKTVESWENIPNDVKVPIAQSFEEELKANPTKREAKIGKHASAALDKFINDEFNKIRTAFHNFQPKPENLEKMRKLKDDGMFLDYIAFFYDKSEQSKIEEKLHASNLLTAQTTDYEYLKILYTVRAYLERKPEQPSTSK